jgi:hypothetical protein
MSTTELITPPRAASGSAHPIVDEALDDTLPVLELIPGYGPPVILLLGPWLLFGLMLAGPFAALFALVVVFAAAAAIVVLAGAILASPYLLVRHLRGSRADHVPAPAPAAPLVAAEPRFTT